MIPYDATNHIQGISQGIGNATPALVEAGKRNAPGNPDLEAFINNSMDDYVKRRQAGEPKESILQDYLTKMKSMQYPNATQQVPSVGANAGVPSLGTPDMSAATNTPPNSFNGSGMLQSFQNPPAGGISGNATPQSASPSPDMGGLPSINNQPVPIPNNTMNGSNMTLDRPGIPGSAPYEQSQQEPIPYEETPKIDLTAGRESGNMSTGHGSLIPPMRTRAQQEEAMGDIERMNKVTNSQDSLDIKKYKLEQQAQVEIMKNMRLTKNDAAELQTKIAGLDLKAQTIVIDMWLKQKAMEQKFKLGNDRNDIARTKAAGSAKMPPELKDVKDTYKFHANEYAKYVASGTAEDLNPNMKRKLLLAKENARNAFNKRAIELGYDPIDFDNPHELGNGEAGPTYEPE